MVRFQIVLPNDAFQALRILAIQEFRDTRKQGAMLVKEALESRGLIGERAYPLNAYEPPDTREELTT